MLSTLTRFNQATLKVMPMNEFLISARATPAAAAAGGGETLPLGGGVASGDNFAKGAVARGGKGARPVTRTATQVARSDSDKIIIRFGHLKGVKGPLDVQALYFPLECASGWLQLWCFCFFFPCCKTAVCSAHDSVKLNDSVPRSTVHRRVSRLRLMPHRGDAFYIRRRPTCVCLPHGHVWLARCCSRSEGNRNWTDTDHRMDEHRCRAWWKAHKHYMRVGDAIVRIVAAQFKNVGTLAPGTLRAAWLLGCTSL